MPNPKGRPRIDPIEKKWAKVAAQCGTSVAAAKRNMERGTGPALQRLAIAREIGFSGDEAIWGTRATGAAAPVAGGIPQDSSGIEKKKAA